MGIKITRRGGSGGGGPPRFNPEAIAKVIAGLVPGMILRRTEKGLDANGQQFAPYSARYRKHLRDLGEDPKVDLRVSGGLMNSIKARSIEILKDAVRVVVAPDAGTSPVWTKRKDKAGRASRTIGKQSPPHNIVGYWLHHGTPKMRARPFMGLTAEQWRTLRAAIAKVMWR